MGNLTCTLRTLLSNSQNLVLTQHFIKLSKGTKFQLSSPGRKFQTASVIISSSNFSRNFLVIESFENCDLAWHFKVWATNAARECLHYQQPLFSIDPLKILNTSVLIAVVK